MKRVRGTRSLIFILAIPVFLLFPGLVFSAASEGGPLKVTHDRKTDLLNVEARGRSLKTLLQRISLLTGVEILVDDAIEKNIHVIVSNKKLEMGLKQIIRSAGGLSYVMIFSDRKSEKKGPLLLTVKIMPAGKEKTAPLKPVVGLLRETVIHSYHPSGARANQGDTPVADYARRRWEERLERMSPEQRERVMKQIEDRQAVQKMREERKEKSKKKKKERQEKRKARDEALKERNPERYELMMKRREDVRERAKERNRAQ